MKEVCFELWHFANTYTSSLRVMVSNTGGGSRFDDMGGHGRGSRRVHPPWRREGVWEAGAPQQIFSLDMLLGTHFGVNNDAKVTQIGDNFGWGMVQNVVNNIRDTIRNV